MRSTTERYTRHHRIATGGMGEVWLAHDEVLHREVAVKYLKREYAEDEGFRMRFLHEARSAAALQHPGIATVFDFGESQVEDGLPFLVMEYVEGRTLSQVLAEGPLDPERARGLVEQAATALATAHDAGMVHRDIKPANLMVTDDDVVKITDFGIARAGEGLALTETGQLMGTPSYLSPEQAEGHSATPASDVYALGVVLFECLTGRRPFVAETPVAVALAQVREPVPDLPPDVPADLAAVVQHALAKHPDERYADAGSLAAALAAVGPQPTLLLSTPVPVAPPAAPLPTALRGRLRIPRERWPFALALALAALLAVVVAVTAMTGDGGGTAQQPTPPPSATPSPTPRVTVDRAAYVGKPAARVRTALVALGLKPTMHTVENSGGHAAGTVASLAPTGSVPAGSSITVNIWGVAPAPSTSPADKPAPKPGKGHGKGKGKH